MGPKSSRPPSRPSGAPIRAAAISDVPKLYDDHEGTETDQTAVIAPKSFRTRRRATLMAMAGSVAGDVFRLEKDRTSIGRSKAADIVLADEGVSRIHCVIVRRGDGAWAFEDHRSTNGTIINGVTKLAGDLAPGDRIQVGAEAVLQFGFFDDAEEELAKKMYEGATRDPLTRALNRRHFFERLGAEVSYATRHNDALAAIVFDVDHFKSINDSYGHAGGDAVLREIGATVGGLLRNEDIFARHGGEEFVVVARGLSLKEGAKLAERVRKTIQDKKLVFEGKRFCVTVSAGVAELREVKTGSHAEELLRLADARLYRAKQAGRNCVFAK